MEQLTSRQIKALQLKKKLLKVLQAKSHQLHEFMQLPPQHSWISTRELANAIHIDIYRARRLLLELAENEEVLVTDRAIKNSLRWHIVCDNDKSRPGDSTLSDKGIQNYMKHLYSTEHR